MKKLGMAAGAVGLSAAVSRVIKPAAAASRDHILIGRPLPLTGPVAAFTESSPWLDNKALADLNKDGGIYIKEIGKKLPLKVKIVDTQSNPTKAAELASKLIVKDKVDIMYVSATPATVNPVSAVCERLKKLPVGHYIDLKTYKRNRSLIIAKMNEEDLLVIENGYFTSLK